MSAASAAKTRHDETPWTRPAIANKLSLKTTTATPLQRYHNAPTPLTPTTPQYRRIQQLRQLRLISRNRFKTKGKTVPPRPTTQPTAASQPATPNLTPTDSQTTPNLTLNTSQTMSDSSMNDSSLSDTLLIATPTLLFDHTDFMNETQSPRHIQYMNGSYIYISHDPI